MPKPVLTCPECGQRFTQRHHRQLFCIPAHGRTYNRRVEGQSQAVMGLAKAWRASRNQKGEGAVREAGKEAFILLCRLIDESNTQDRVAGRMNPAKVYMQRCRYNMMG